MLCVSACPSEALAIEGHNLKQTLSELRKADKPVLACFLGGGTVDPGARYLMEHRVPTYPFPERGR